jgi:2-hydroxycyclohexanecarboxyl-CoA dehydrogenase
MNDINGLNLQRLDGQVALIIGGTSGIGFRIGELFAKAGATVILNGRNKEKGEIAVKNIKEITDKVVYIEGDCVHYNRAQHVIQQVQYQFGTVDILVASGGLGIPPTLFHKLSPEDITTIINTRYLTRLNPIHAVLPIMQENNQGKIILIGTDAARHPTPGEAIHGGIGAALILLTKALARELSRSHIRVNGLALTLTSDTPGYEMMFKKPGFENDLFSKALKRFPWGAAPTAEEVARVALFLASDLSAQVTGQTISVNGGLSFGGW